MRKRGRNKRENEAGKRERKLGSCGERIEEVEKTQRDKTEQEEGIKKMI